MVLRPSWRIAALGSNGRPKKFGFTNLASITSGGAGGSGSASGGSRVRRDVGSGGEETGRRKVIGDGSGNRVCTIGLLLTG